MGKKHGEPIGVTVGSIIGECKQYKTIAQFLNDIGCAFNLSTHDWTVVEVDDHMEVVNTVGDTVFDILLTSRELIEDVYTYYTILVPEIDMTEPVKVMNCPICEVGEMKYRSLPNMKAFNEEELTHVWVCDECPNVMMEWYDRSDSEAMVNYFK